MGHHKLKIMSSNTRIPSTNDLYDNNKSHMKSHKSWSNNNCGAVDNNGILLAVSIEKGDTRPKDYKDILKKSQYFSTLLVKNSKNEFVAPKFDILKRKCEDSGFKFPSDENISSGNLKNIAIQAFRK